MLGTGDGVYGVYAHCVWRMHVVMVFYSHGGCAWAQEVDEAALEAAVRAEESAEHQVSRQGLLFQNVYIPIKPNQYRKGTRRLNSPTHPHDLSDDRSDDPSDPRA